MTVNFRILAIASLLVVGCGESSKKAAEGSEMPDINVQAVTGVLNPNLASNDELLSLPHITEEKVNTIVQSRPFLQPQAFIGLIQREFSQEQTTEILERLFLPMNLNTTPEEQFLSVPGVGERMAHEFEEYRPYTSIEQFRREIGKYVDDDQVALYEQYVFVPVNLNTASKEEILAIPGVGERMLHEFEEYRPYESIEQFRREIGKYVDDNELQRLERYVTL